MGPNPVTLSSHKEEVWTETDTGPGRMPRGDQGRDRGATPTSHERPDWPANTGAGREAWNSSPSQPSAGASPAHVWVLNS